jgi:hypothetical protein
MNIGLCGVLHNDDEGLAWVFASDGNFLEHDLLDVGEGFWHCLQECR